MNSGPTLIAADAGAYQALGDVGEPVWQRAAQLRAAIDTRLGRRHADLFAVPHDQGGRIEWRAPFDGTPRRYVDLPEAEKRALQSKVQELRPDLERLVERLDSPERSDGERAFGRLLRLALIAPGPETLFAVDSRPVLAFWGFCAEGTPGMLLGIAAAPPAAPAWSPGPATSPPAAAAWTAPPVTSAPPAALHGNVPPGTGAPPPSAVAPPAAMAAVVPAAAPTWWKWLLLALFLLLLLAVAAYFVKPHLPQWVWDGKFTLPATAGTEPGTSGGVDDAALRAEQARAVALRNDFASLWAQFLEKRNQCAAGRQGTGPGGTVVVPGTGTGPDGTVTQGPGAEDGTKAPGNAPQPDAKTEPGTADRKAAPKPPEAKPPRAEAKPPPDPKAAPKTETQRPPQQATRPTDPRAGRKPDERPIDPVRIPKGPGVDFMEGEWRSSTDLTTQSGDELIRPQYTFDKDGKGKSRIVQKNGVVCEGPAQASRDPSGRLVIRETEPLKCSDGTSYAPSTVTCESGSDGRAQCQGRSEGGPTYAVQLGK